MKNTICSFRVRPPPRKIPVAPMHIECPTLKFYFIYLYVLSCIADFLFCKMNVAMDSTRFLDDLKTECFSSIVYKLYSKIGVNMLWTERER